MRPLLSIRLFLLFRLDLSDLQDPAALISFLFKDDGLTNRNQIIPPAKKRAGFNGIERLNMRE